MLVRCHRILKTVVAARDIRGTAQIQDRDVAGFPEMEGKATPNRSRPGPAQMEMARPIVNPKPSPGLPLSRKTHCVLEWDKAAVSRHIEERGCYGSR